MRTLKALALLALSLPLAFPARAALSSKGLDKTTFTSDFMIGSVVVSIIFLESDGTLDPNLETWSNDRKTQVLSQIMSGLTWWTKQNPRSPLSFTYVSQTLSTKYEPITRPYYDEALWIPDVMSKIGYPGNRFTATRNYINALRAQYKTDWGYVIFVVDSQNDANGKFADGLFAYAYLGGPFLVTTYDNDGYGINNMNVVVAHETGHIFNALDEYAGASSPNDYSYGYFPTINGNHAYSTTANEPESIMRGGLRWGLDNWAKLMIGWRDNDNNNLDDIFQKASAQISGTTSGGSGGSSSFTGDAAIAFLPRQANAQGFGLTVDTLSQVEYRLPSGGWASAVATDGAFDSANENFRIDLPSGLSAQAVRAQDVELRVVTSYSTKSGSGATSGSGSGSSAPASTLDNAHAFPNPFKPNSGLGHTDVIFTNLTTGAKVQIFTVSGEPVFDKELPSGAGSLSWGAVDKDGQKVASGVYYYLITDPQGHKKDGKIAVIR